MTAYLFASTLDGPTLSEYVTQWASTARAHSQQGFQFMRQKLGGKKAVSVRSSTEELYRDVELPLSTYNALRSAIADAYFVPCEAVQRIVRDGDVLVRNDGDVSRLNSTHRLEVLLDDTVRPVLDTLEEVGDATGDAGAPHAAGDGGDGTLRSTLFTLDGQNDQV
eukprot:TRINITY_DN8071_c0_g1_i1.p1 TRINITY_DN8071_c0_g1~~TRINITY_DN8071_c0_g1_i1.p1  ORF type:complete len:165 (+),score=25.61 TRINITY_DN8071_c0_g1_i1:277-771(+)